MKIITPTNEGERSEYSNEVVKTFDQAVALLDGEHPLIHSDRGFQYTSKGFRRKIDEAEMTQSMSRVGRSSDNGPMESFWEILKCEKYYLHTYKSFEELSNAIEAYIFITMIGIKND